MEPPSCAIDSKFDDSSGLCVHKERPGCPPDFKFDGSACVAEGPAKCEDVQFNGNICEALSSCPEGHDIYNNECWKESPFACPAGTEEVRDEDSDDNKCCMKGFELVDGKCHLPGNDPDNCPSGSEFDEHLEACITPPVHARCPIVYAFEDDKCIIRSIPDCLGRGTLINGV